MSDLVCSRGDQTVEAVTEWLGVKRIREAMLRARVIAPGMVRRLPELMLGFDDLERQAVVSALLRDDRVMTVVAQHMQSKHDWPFWRAMAALEELRKWEVKEEPVPPPDGMRVL